MTIGILASDVLSSEDLKKAIEKLLDYKRRHTNYTAELYRLISKADPINRARLGRVYPFEVFAFELWQSSQDEIAFFATFGVTLPPEMVDRL